MVGTTFCATFVGIMGGGGVAVEVNNDGISWTAVDGGGWGGAGGVQSLASFVSFIHCSG